jgi:serine/threonine-protein kinase
MNGNIGQAISFFEEAIATDPLDARAWAGLADAWFLLAFWGAVPPHTAMPKAREAALRALELDDLLPEAHASLGAIQIGYEWQREAGERSFRRALDLDPDYGPGCQALAGQVLFPAGRIEEAIEMQRRAIALDPLAPNPQATLTFFLGLTGRIDEAIAQHRATLATNPAYFFAHSTMAVAYSANGMTSEALEEIKRTFAAAQGHPSVLSGMAYFHALHGERERGLEFLTRAIEASGRTYVPAVEIAAACTAFDDRARTFEWLERALEERSVQLFFLCADPRYRPLHGDPAFARVLKRIGQKLPGARSQGLGRELTEG